MQLSRILYFEQSRSETCLCFAFLYHLRQRKFLEVGIKTIVSNLKTFKEIALLNIYLLIKASMVTVSQLAIMILIIHNFSFRILPSRRVRLLV